MPAAGSGTSDTTGSAGIPGVGAVLFRNFTLLWASRFVGSLLFGLEPRDLPTLLAATATLAGICLLAAGLPARRAARIDPAEVLRQG